MNKGNHGLPYSHICCCPSCCWSWRSTKPTSTSPLPSAPSRSPAPGPRPSSSLTDSEILLQTNKQAALPQGACGQGKEMPWYLVSSLFSFWLLDLQMGSSHSLEAGPASSDSCLGGG